MEVEGFIATVVEELFPEFALVIEVLPRGKNAWINLVNHGGGVKLVSLWIAFLMLILSDDRPKEDPNLYWSVFRTSDGWSDSSQIGEDIGSRSGPALAVHNDRLYAAFQGGDDDNLRWIVYDYDTGMSEEIWFPTHHSTDHSPALASFDGHLHMVHRGGDYSNDMRILHTIYDGTAWGPSSQVGDDESYDTPALANYCAPNADDATAPEATTEQLFVLNRGIKR